MGAPAVTSVNAESVPIAISMEVDKVHAPMPLPAQHPSPAPDTDSYSAILKGFPGLTLPKLGHYPNFQHCIELQPGTVPVATRMWPVLLALHDKVKEAVRELDHQEIWEQCDKSEWALRMVTPMKLTGEVCITMVF